MSHEQRINSNISYCDIHVTQKNVKRLYYPLCVSSRYFFTSELSIHYVRKLIFGETVTGERNVGVVEYIPHKQVVYSTADLLIPSHYS